MGPLSDDAVVRLISSSFVPVALNLYKIRVEKGEAGDFFRSVQKQKDQYQGLWVVSPGWSESPAGSCPAADADPIGWSC